MQVPACIVFVGLPLEYFVEAVLSSAPLALRESCRRWDPPSMPSEKAGERRHFLFSALRRDSLGALTPATASQMITVIMKCDLSGLAFFANVCTRLCREWINCYDAITRITPLGRVAVAIWKNADARVSKSVGVGGQ
jgi:hypothetical protein